MRDTSGTAPDRALTIVIAVLGATLLTGCADLASYASRASQGVVPPAPLSGNLEIARAIRAQRLMRSGDCLSARREMAGLSAAFVATTLNRASLTDIEGQCLFFVDGEMDRGFHLSQSVYGLDAHANGEVAASVSIMAAHRCDLDAAIDWAYRSTERRDEFLTDRGLVLAASFLAQQGRPGAARRAFSQYLEDYPEDWYTTWRSTPTGKVEYDRSTADVVHREARSSIWLWLRALGDPTPISQEDLDGVRRLAQPGWTPTIHYGRYWNRSPVGDYYYIGNAARLDGAIKAAGELGLDASQVAALRDELRLTLDRMGTSGSLCREVATATAEYVTLDIVASEADTDRDGIPNYVDPCPTQAEIINGIEDGDGCPDVAPARVEQQQIVIDEHIQFALDSAELLPQSLSILDAVARILLSYPDIRYVRVEGHTDSRGSLDYNQVLSERRAQAVADYLTRKGVERGRLVSVGFGERYPITFAETEKGREMNRRVEFLILERAGRMRVRSR